MIEKRKFTSLIETDRELSLHDKVGNALISSLTKDIYKMVIEVIQELELCEEGKEVEFLTNNECFKEGNSYYLRGDKGLFHLFNITSPEFTLQNNIVNDSVSAFGSMMIEKICKKLR